MTDALRQRDRELAQHPRECLDFACVASLGAWVATASTWLDMGDGPMVMTSMQAAHPELSPAPVGVFLTHLLRRLALADPTIQPMADGLQALETLAFGGGVGRQWKPADVFSEDSCGTCLIVSISGPQTGAPCTSEARSEPRYLTQGAPAYGQGTHVYW
jgi:hypothetical protein